MNPEVADTYATLIESLQPLAAALREAFPKPAPVPVDDVGVTVMATWVEPPAPKVDD